MILHRRKLLTAGAGLAGTALLGGCDRFAGTETGRRTLKVGEDANLFVQRLLMSPATLAREYPAAMISPWFKPNGTIDPPDREFRALAAKKFSDFKLTVDGLVQTPLSLSLADLRGLPARTQITRHDCVEGWSAIGQWQGPMLGTVLKAAGMRNTARYIVFTCADLYNGQPYYESIDTIDAFHPQTILALKMNGARLTVPHGAPVRLRVERQLGYKHAKYVTGIDAVASLATIGKGKGGYWEDNVDYDWYAGI
jgi:DMSO/TMAO reductase YedYZ molybdopterin-dependent catalytic subunit